MADTRDLQYGKTSPERSVPTKARTSAVSSKVCAGSRTKAFLLLDVRNGKPPERYWQMSSQLPGECSTRNTGESPREENASTLVCRSAPLSLRDTSPTGGDHADFDGECAGKVLFESEGLSGYSAEGFKAWQRFTAVAESGSGATGAAGFCTEHSAKARGIGYEEEASPTLRAGTVPAAVYENHSQDTRYTGPLEVAPTVSSTYGMGGNNQPFVVSENPKCFDVRFTSEGTRNARQNCYETETSRTIDTGGNSPDSNQGGVAVVAVQGSMIGRAEKNGPQGSGVNEEVSFTLNATDRHAVAFSQETYDKYAQNDKCGLLRACGGMYGGGSETLVYSTSKNSHHTEAEENLANTLVASDYKDPPTVNSPEYIVRRLTPTECARLQGFPDWWCADLGTGEPTAEELRFWKDVFETHRKIVGGAVKPKSEKQIRAWLKNPHSDSAEYKLWGNGVCLNIVVMLMFGIKWAADQDFS